LLSFRLGRFDQALALFEESLILLRPLDNPALLVDTLILSAIMLHLCGDIDGSLERMREGSLCAAIAGDTWFHIYAHYNVGYILTLMGRYEEGYELMRHSLEAWRATADPRSISLGLNFLTPTAVHLGQYEQAREWLEESIALTSKLGDRWGLGTAYRHLGFVALAEGNIAEAETHLHQSLDQYQGFVIGYDLIHTNLFLGECAAAKDEIERAEQILQDAIRGAVNIRVEALAMQGLADLAELRLRHGQAAEALSLATAVLARPSATCETAARAAELRRCAGEQLGDEERMAAEAKIRGLSLTEMVNMLH
jgi:tetratricopeptide (TPR) repeat protein